MKRMYQLKVLAWIGSVVLASVLAFLLLAWLIPPFKAPEPSRQLFTIRHQELRDNNPLYTDLFLQSIKHNTDTWCWAPRRAIISQRAITTTF